jgi:hypothetical protein
VSEASPVSTLLVDVQRRLEALYALEHQAPVTEFLIPLEHAHDYPGGGSRTLVTQKGDDVSLGVVLEDSVRTRLAAGRSARAPGPREPRPLLRGRGGGQPLRLPLLLREAARQVTQLELELQGEVDKYLSSVFLLCLQNEGAVSPLLRELLFRQYRLAAHVTGRGGRARYHRASELAYRYCGYLESRFLRPSRLQELAREARRFYRLGQRDKLERIAALQ